jgi:DNA ligase-1
MPLKPMLAKDADLSAVAWPQIAQPKLDGIRATVQDGVVLSRTLKPIPNKEVQRRLAHLEGFDGELIVGDPTHPDCYRRTSSFVMAPDKLFPDVQEPWTFYVFDLLTHAESPYALRADRLRMAFDRAGFDAGSGDYVRLVPSLGVDDIAALDEYEADLLAAGHEGVILRDPAAPYKHGRSGKSGPLLKVKRFIDFEAKVIGVYEELHNGNVPYTNALGRTERASVKAFKTGKGTLGGLVLRAINGPAEGIEFRCGTGFDAAMRQSLWLTHHAPSATHPPVVGRVAKIKSFPIGVKDKPRHPVFLGWRDIALDG